MTYIAYHQCDKCGDKIEKKDIIRNLHSYSANYAYTIPAMFELCNKCVSALDKWIKEG